MSRVAFLTMADRADYVIDDDVVIPELERRGITVDEVPWTEEVDWSVYDLVVVRTTWDYQHDVERFLSVLEQIAEVTHVVNSLEVIRWNVHKSYLRALEAAGVLTVPTIWGVGLDDGQLSALAMQEGVLKPVVGAGGADTFRIGSGMTAPTASAQRADIIARFVAREWMAQPFVASVLTEGEYSLFWFASGPGGALEFSHAIVKRPKDGDFRVQEEWGGEIVAVDETATVLRELRVAGERVLAACGRERREPLLQARVDLVRLADGRLALMELELVEPSLYFRTSEVAATKFADAVCAWLKPDATTPRTPATPSR